MKTQGSIQIKNISFTTKDRGTLYFRKTSGSLRDDLFLRSIGFFKGYRKVLDGTCGLAVDSVYLAQKGCYVLALEKSQYIYSLLKKALSELRISPLQIDWGNRFNILNLDFLEFDPTINKSVDPSISADFHIDKPDVVYLDPMFSETYQKSALPKKETQWLRTHAEENSDQQVEEMILKGLNCAQHRVVLKRPLKSPYIFPKLCQHSYKGKAIRFDVYLVVQSKID